jgi:hypothetical protein
MRVVPYTLAAALIGMSVAQADPVTWIATSKTAMSITGDIVLDDYSLTFKTGKTLDLEPYERDRMGDWAGSGKKVAGYVYKIDPPSNPKLLRGNSLCGAPVT